MADVRIVELWPIQQECHACGVDITHPCYCIEWYEDRPTEGSGFYVPACKACHDRVYGGEDAR